MGNLGTKEQRSKSILFLKKIHFHRGTMRSIVATIARKAHSKNYKQNSPPSQLFIQKFRIQFSSLKSIQGGGARRAAELSTGRTLLTTGKVASSARHLRH
ncbi:hypothetical protein QL285_051263 [Trifolium repens]|nr:hypothetical protein QL285_051263 [Trifolium repens]